MSEQSSYSWQPFGGSVKVTIFSSALEDIEGDIINAGERARGVLLASRIRDQVAVINALAMGSGAAAGGTLQTSIEHMQEVLSVWRDSTTLPNPVGAYRWIRSGEDGESVCRRELPGIKKFLKGPPYVFIVFQRTESGVEGIAFFDQDEETLQRLPIEVKLSGEPTGAAPSEPPRVAERRGSLSRLAEKRQDEGTRSYTSDWPETQYVPTPSAPAVHPLMQSGVDVNDSALHRDYPVPGDFIAPPPAPTRAVDTVSSSPPPLPFETTRNAPIDRPPIPSRSSDLEQAAPERAAVRSEPAQRTELPYEAFATLSAAATPEPETKTSNTWIAVAAVVAVMLAGLAWFLLRSPSSPTAVTPVNGSLDLHITRRNGDLEISWDRNAQAIAKANKGLLTINDGGKKTDLYLEDSHLRTGRVLYSPVTGDIDVRLEIEQNAASPISESVRVISAGGEKSPAASAPVSAPEPVQTRRREADSGVQTARVDPQQQQLPAARRVTDPGERKIYVPPPQARPSMPQGTARLEAAAPQVASNDLGSVSGPPVSALPTAPAAPAPEPTPAPNRMVQGPPVPAPVVPERRRPTRQAETAPVLPDRASPVPVSQSPVVVPTALRSMITGPIEVRVGVVVSNEGRVVAASTVPPNSPLMNQLSKIASDAAMRWRFDPAVRNGKAVAGRYELVFRFRK